MTRVHSLVREGHLVLTRKAAQELAALEIDLRPGDVGQVLLELRPLDAVRRLRSERDGAWLYIFRPTVEGLAIYLKLAVRENCVVISFHEHD